MNEDLVFALGGINGINSK